LVPLGQARLARHGTDLTVVATGLMVSRALEAAQQLMDKSIDVEVVDPRTVSPIDWSLIFASVEKTGRVMVVNEATLTCSVASEIAATIAEKRFSSLDAPVRRIGSVFAPKPSTPGLEKLSYPSVEQIVELATEMMPRKRA
jgi:pyruvate dehydrogenase E1 component beta subunit